MIASLANRRMLFAMRRWVAMFLMLASVAANPAAQASSLSPTDVTAITAVSETFGKMVLAKNSKAAAALYTSDGVLYPLGESAVKGRTSIEACLTGLPPVTAFALRNTRVDGHDDLAYVQGTFTMTLMPPGASSPEQASGYFLQVLRRQPDGRWQIAVQMFTSH